MDPMILGGLFIVIAVAYGFVKFRKPATATANGPTYESVQASIARRDNSSSVLERLLRGRKNFLTGKIERNLVTANIAVKPHEFVAANLIFLVFVIILDLMIIRSMSPSGGLFGIMKVLFVFVFMPWLGWKFPQMVLQFLADKRRNTLEIQLAEALTLISSGLKGGYSFIQGLSMAADQLEEPITSEINRVVRLIQLGLDTPRALEQMAQRINSYDYDMTVSATNIQLSSGGNLSVLLEKIAETIRDRIRLRRDIAALTAQGRISGAILIALPLGIAFFLNILNPEYFSLLYSTDLGVNLLSWAFIQQSLGVYWIKRLLDFDK